MKYFVARIQFYKSEQKRLSKKESPEKPIELIERLLRENPEYKPENEKRGIGLLFGNFMPNTGELVAARVGRSKEGLWEDYDIKAKKFIETPKTKFPSVLILWDSAEQAIIVERRTTIFPIIQSFFNSLENHFNSLLRPYEIRVSIIPLTRDIDFWNTIENYDEIYSVTFDLRMPNFLGITNKSVKEILEHVRQENNGSELSTTISNENGTLKLIRDSWVTPFVNWIKLGGVCG